MMKSKKFMKEDYQMIEFTTYVKSNEDFMSLINLVKGYGSARMLIRRVLPRFADKIKNSSLSQLEPEILKSKGSFIEDMDLLKKIVAKKIDVLQAGLLIHGTATHDEDYDWTNREILDLPKQGLLPSAYTGKTIEYGSSWGSLASGRRSTAVFLSMTTKSSYFGEKSWGDGKFRVFFIIDPKYVDDNPQNFVADNTVFAWAQNREEGQEKAYVDFVRRKRIPAYTPESIKRRFNLERYATVYDQILHDGTIPLKHIAGIAVVDDDLLPNIIRIVRTLSRRYPDKGLPVYNKEGDMVWP